MAHQPDGHATRKPIRRSARSMAAAVAVLAATFVSATLAAATQAGPPYLAVGGWSAVALNGNIVSLSATTNGTIPKVADEFITENAITGIAWADLGTGTGLVATIHPSFGRDSHQRKDGWHLHTVQLGGGATAPNDFCLVAVLSTPTAGIAIKGDTMSINLDASAMPDAGNGPISIDALDAAVGFTVHGDGACGSGFGVRIRT